MKESDLFNPTRNWLELNGWTVYGEVGGQGGARADLVGELDGHYVVCEMKRSLSLKVIEQAENWKATANLVFIVVPYHPNGISSFTYKLLKQLGIGLIEVDLDFYNVYGGLSDEDDGFDVTDEIRDQTWLAWKADVPGVYIRYKHYLHRYNKHFWDSRIYPELKDQIGGVKGAYMTPYKITRQHVKTALLQAFYNDMDDPRGIYNLKTAGYRSVADLVEIVETHYTNPASGIYKILSDWEADKVDAIKRGRRIYYRLKELPDYNENSKYLRMFN